MHAHEFFEIVNKITTDCHHVVTASTATLIMRHINAPAVASAGA